MTVDYRDDGTKVWCELCRAFVLPLHSASFEHQARSAGIEIPIDAEIAARYRRAFESGKKASRCGFSRISPFYGDEWVDWWFLNGFDGLTIDQTWEKFREENKQVMFAMLPGLKEIYE